MELAYLNKVALPKLPNSIFYPIYNVNTSLQPPKLIKKFKVSEILYVLPMF